MEANRRFINNAMIQETDEAAMVNLLASIAESLAILAAAAHGSGAMATETEQALQRLRDIQQARMTDPGHVERVESDWRTQSVATVKSSSENPVLEVARASIAHQQNQDA